ncbi:GNAT family N-acetyltransferase [Sinomonas sp. JGH33]|uniref:GNAT family N-acetyltransferase n=1 Tax=Sinomonas terricola TaxID=3110330 RepID=A0ABU5T5P1_9MICC|nr:GNAT family N-acetyltransferase [Sinomonas sp. JGH33]MEA5454857.1 GNAT family N-acetyltransferase [Sinomonas sp. JGH33]
MDFEIRDAGPDDAEELLAVKDQGWREAYAHLLSPEFLAALGGDEERTERWRGILANDDGGWHFAVGCSRGRIVGMAGAGPALDGDAPQAEEVYTVYVLAEAYGTGLAHALVDRVIGRRAAFLWVFEDNPRAIAFYTKLGFAPDGAGRVEEFDGRRLPEIRMVRR